MSLDSIPPESVISAIEKEIPAPENPFERAYYFMSLKRTIEELEVFFAKEYNDLIDLIKDEPSEIYEVVMTYKRKSSVDVDRLREVRPDLIEIIGYVKSNLAEKILSRRRLYELCREAVGEKIESYVVVNKGDLDKNLPEDEVGQFIKYEDEPAGYVVSEKIV